MRTLIVLFYEELKVELVCYLPKENSRVMPVKIVQNHGADILHDHTWCVLNLQAIASMCIGGLEDKRDHLTHNIILQQDPLLVPHDSL